MRKVTLSLLLVLAVAYTVAADGCNFNFYRNANGSFARLELRNDHLSAIQINKDSSWTSYIKHEDIVNITTESGVSKLEQFSELPIGERYELFNLLTATTKGYEVTSYNGGIELGHNKSLLLKTHNEEDNSLSIKASGWYASLRAQSASFKYNHVFFLSSSAVILLDDVCEQPLFMKFKNLDPVIKMVLNKIIESPWE